MSKLSNFIEQLDSRYPVCYDVETTSLMFWDGRIFGFSLVQIHSKPLKIWIREPFEKNDIRALKDFLADPKYRKVAWNLKFDWLYSLFNLKIPNIVNYEDTMIKTYLWNENLGSYKLKPLAKRLLFKNKYAQKILKYVDQVDEELKKMKVVDYSKVNPELMRKYATSDGLLTLYLDEHVNKTWESELDQPFDIDMKLLKTLVNIEKDGVDVDLKYLKKLNSEFLEKRDDILNFIIDTDLISGIDSQESLMKLINSDKQIGKLLFEDLRLSGDKIDDKFYTKGGNYKVDAETLKILIDNNPNDYGVIISKIIEYNSVEFSLNTYVEPYLENILTYGKVYPSYNQLIVTGRLSCRNPNMQNLPKKGEKHGDKIRHIIYNPDHKTHILLNPDYNQEEYRLLAHYTQSNKLINGYLAGEDFHTNTAKELELSRRNAKDVNFAMIYGVGNSGLAAKLGIPVSQARSYRMKYFYKNPEVKQLMKDVQRTVEKKGYVRTFYRRRRRLKPEKGYIGLNAIIQGTAAEIIKLTMIRITEQIPEVEIKLQVHDELVIKAPKDPKYEKQIVECMEDTKTFRVPITVDVTKFNKNWGVK